MLLSSVIASGLEARVAIRQLCGFAGGIASGASALAMT
jgi:hypothetical protein